MASQSTRKLWTAAGAVAAVLATAGLRGEILDRIVAIVGIEAITFSQVDDELRLEAMLNRETMDRVPEASRDALRRLVDRRLVLQDLAVTPFLFAQPAESERQVRQLRAQTYLDGRDFAAALAHYGLTEEDCRAFIEERIGFERYVSFRFKTGLDAEPAAMESHYRDEYSRLQREQGEPVEPFESVSGRISRILLERQANQLLEERLKELRTLSRIEILAFSGAEERP